MRALFLIVRSATPPNTAITNSSATSLRTKRIEYAETGTNFNRSGPVAVAVLVAVTTGDSAGSRSAGLTFRPAPGLRDLADRPPDQHCQRRDNFRNRRAIWGPHAPPCGRLPADVMPLDNRKNYKRTDARFDQLDENVGQRLHLYAEGRIHHTRCEAGNNANDNLDHLSMSDGSQCAFIATVSSCCWCFLYLVLDCRRGPDLRDS